MNHPNILKFYGAVEIDENNIPKYKIVTEKLARDLEDYINDNKNDKKTVSVEEKVSILGGIIEGLSYLHSEAEYVTLINFVGFLSLGH